MVTLTLSAICGKGGRGICSALSTEEKQLLVNADGSILKHAIVIEDLVRASKKCLDILFESTTEQRQFRSIIESKHSSELVKLHCIFRIGCCLLEVLLLNFSLGLQKLSRASK
jgi:hypothetical protein